VWSDGSDGATVLTSARAYQFLARASGGVTFWTNAAGTVGATLAPGSGTWASASDRNLKTDEDGVALAAIKALHAENASLRARLAAVTTSQEARAQRQARRDAAVQLELQRLSARVDALRR
jgi:hypothetical protein